MRDDLHRTVALPRSWKRVLKFACSQADFDRAQIAMTRAINAEFDNEVGHRWLGSLRMALATDSPDMFDGDRSIPVIESFERKNPTALQRKMLENMAGLIARGITGPALIDKAVNAVCHQVAGARVAHTTSLIAKVADNRDTAIAAKLLSEIAQSCEFSVTKPRRKARSGDDTLGLVITADSLGRK